MRWTFPDSGVLVPANLYSRRIFPYLLKRANVNRCCCNSKARGRICPETELFNQRSNEIRVSFVYHRRVDRHAVLVRSFATRCKEFLISRGCLDKNGSKKRIKENYWIVYRYIVHPRINRGEYIIIVIYIKGLNVFYFSSFYFFFFFWIYRNIYLLSGEWYRIKFK